MDGLLLSARGEPTVLAHDEWDTGVVRTVLETTSLQALAIDALPGDADHRYMVISDRSAVGPINPAAGALMPLAREWRGALLVLGVTRFGRPRGLDEADLIALMTVVLIGELQQHLLDK